MKTSRKPAVSIQAVTGLILLRMPTVIEKQDIPEFVRNGLLAKFAKKVHSQVHSDENRFYTHQVHGPNPNSEQCLVHFVAGGGLKNAMEEFRKEIKSEQIST